MTERFKRLFSGVKNVYAKGAPLLISAGALLQDSYSGNLLAQVKYKSVSLKKITAVTVAVTMLDAAGKSLGEPVKHKYENLNISRDGEFGRSAAIVLPDPAVRAFSVDVLEVVFDDGDTWTAQGPWEPLKELKTLEEVYGDVELANQYRIRYGSDCKYAPLDAGEFWFCNCGGVNFPTEAKCHLCRRSLKAQQNVNLASLRSECAERVKLEQEQAEIEAAEAKKRKKKRIVTAALLLPLLVALIVAAFAVPKALELNRSYESAVRLLNAHDFDKARDAFIALGKYRDSAEQADKNVPYMEAVYIMDSAVSASPAALSVAGIDRAAAEETPLQLLLYDAAIERFTALEGYKDSADLAEQCSAAVDAFLYAQAQEQYNSAAALLDGGHYLQARDAFAALDGFGDSLDMEKEAIYRKAVSLFGFIEKYDIRGISAVISTDAKVPSRFYISQSAALKLDTSVVSDLKAACGEDPADVRIEDANETAAPLSDALTEMFASLGKYKDAAEYGDKIAIAIDYTRAFFELCRSGELYQAYDWLNAYEEEFPDREHWLSLLDTYKPFCDSWGLYSGDSTLLPISAGKSEACRSFDTCVIIDGETATLRFTGTGSEEFTLDAPAALGETRFIYNDGVYSYFTAISVVDHLAYMKYDSGGSMRSSCEYSRMK